MSGPPPPADIVRAYATAPGWVAAGGILRAHAALLLGEEASELLRALEAGTAGGDAVRLRDRVMALDECRSRGIDEVFVPRETSERLGGLGRRIFADLGSWNAASVAADCRRALVHPALEKDAPPEGFVLLRLAEALVLQSDTAQPQRLLQEALAAYERARALLPAHTFPTTRARATQAIGELRRRSLDGDRAENVELAIRELEAALGADEGGDSAERANTHNSLGVAYRQRLAGEAEESFDAATRHLAEAASMWGRLNRLDRQGTSLRNLGETLSEARHLSAGTAVPRACQVLWRAVEIFAKAGLDAEAARTKSSMGQAFLRLANEEDVPAAWEHGIDLLGESLATDWAASDRIDRARAHLNLATALVARHGASADDRAAALRQIGQAMSLMDPEHDPLDWLGALVGEGRLHAEMGRWADAHAAYAQAIHHAETALAGASSLLGSLHAVRHADVPYTYAAEALLRLGRPEEAAALVDAGRARMLKRAIAQHGAPDDAAVSRPLADALALLPAGAAAVVPCVTVRGTFVFVVPAGTGRVEPSHVVAIDRLTTDRIRALTVGIRYGAPGWLMRIVEIATAGTDEERWEAVGRFADTIGAAGGVLARELLAPVLDRLRALGVREGSELLVAPDDELAMVPWAALPLTDGRQLLDVHAVSLAPSVGIYARCAERRRRLEADPAPASALAVIDPSGNLAWARHEGDALAGLVGQEHCRVLSGASATVREVGSAVVGRRHVHFACHGTFAWSRAGASSIALADGQVTAEELPAAFELHACRLAVLSACETALVNFIQAPAQFLGLPASVLQAGAAGTLVTLWRVDDLAMALLVSQCYRELLGAGRAPAAALRRAQRWLRDATVDALVSAHPWLADVAALRELDGGERPFSDPYYWAGLLMVGA